MKSSQRWSPRLLVLLLLVCAVGIVRVMMHDCPSSLASLASLSLSLSLTLSWHCHTRAKNSFLSRLTGSRIPTTLPSLGLIVDIILLPLQQSLPPGKLR